MVVEERFPGGHFPKCVVLQAVYWYLRYSLSYRDIEELMEERGIKLDHATVQRWVIKYTPLIEAEFRKKKKAVGSSWRMDETYIKIKGTWYYLYRAVDKEGNTIDFLLTKKRDTKAAKRFLGKAINHNGLPEKKLLMAVQPIKLRSKNITPTRGHPLRLDKSSILTTLLNKNIEVLSELQTQSLDSSHFVLPE